MMLDEVDINTSFNLYIGDSPCQDYFVIIPPTI